MEQAFSLQAEATRTIPSDPHLFLTKKGVDDRATAEAYYQAVDPSGEKTTFNKWKRANGFRVNPDANKDGNAFNDDNKTKEVSAAYLNAVDLNLGRAMHAKERTDGLAYYVCNHPTVNDAVRSKKLIACVAMDYSVVLGVNGNQAFTKFYVFGNKGKRIPSADLDGRGEKYVPALCMACHGGTHANGRFFQTGDNPNVAAQFLPFDLDNFEYSTRRRFTRDAQEDKFRGLNQIVKATAPEDAITQLVDGWYPGGIGEQFSAFLPPEWETNPSATPPVPASAPDLYQEVVKTSCRTCHVAMGDGLDWAQFDEFERFSPTIRTDVCRDRIMPQALVTFNRFWLSDDPFQVDVLRLAGLSGWPSNAECPCGGPGEPSCVVAPICGDSVVTPPEQCDDGNTTNGDGCSSTCTTEPPPPFSQIQAIFDDNSKSNACTNSGCHSGTFAPDLRSGSAHDQLVDELSTACSGKDRVEPNDAANSCLFLKVTGMGGGSKMPLACSGDRPAGNCLSPAQIKDIENWINGGALP